MLTSLIILVYAVGYVLAYPRVVRWAIKDLSRITPLRDKDRAWIGAWTIFASLFWPFLFIWMILGGALKKFVVKQENKIAQERK